MTEIQGQSVMQLIFVDPESPTSRRQQDDNDRNPVTREACKRITLQNQPKKLIHDFATKGVQYSKKAKRPF